eukprot:3937123-Rhodomonas_salina.4
MSGTDLAYDDILAWRIDLCACYAMSGTDIAMVLPGGVALHARGAGQVRIRYPISLLRALRNVRYCHTTCCCLPTRVLRDVRC